MQSEKLKFEAELSAVWEPKKPCNPVGVGALDDPRAPTVFCRFASVRKYKGFAHAKNTLIRNCVARDVEDAIPYDRTPAGARTHLFACRRTFKFQFIVPP